MESMLATLYKSTEAMLNENRLDKAAPILRQIVDQMPKFGEALYNLGLCLCRMDQDEEALAYLHRCVEQRPEDWQAYSVMARCYGNLGQLDQSVTCLREALRINPENKQTQWKLAYYLLMKGDFDAAAPYEEWWRTCGERARIKTWYGRRSPGDSIFVYPDGGIGDSINYFRYCLLLGPKWSVKHVYVGVYNELFELFARRIPREYLINFGPVAARNNGSECILNWDVDIPKTNSRAYQSDLFPIFKFDHHGEICPYLTANTTYAQKWEHVIRSWDHTNKCIRVGLVWQGHTGGNNDDKRSIPLKLFKPLDQIEGVSLYSLQAKYGMDQIGAENDHPRLYNLGRRFDLHSMEDIAGAIQHMDLVISVCTGAAHLAAAMGKPTWLLLSKLACWRWLRDREDTPWYPTMRLFRQDQDNDWHRVIRKVCQELMLASKRSLNDLNKSPVEMDQMVPGHMLEASSASSLE